MDHLSFEQIHCILEDRAIASPQRKRIEDHLAACISCQKTFLGLKAITESLGRSFPEGKASPNCREDWELALLIKEEASPNQTKEFLAHLQDCTHCLGKAAGYYKVIKSQEEKKFVVPKSWEKRAVSVLQGQESHTEERVHIFHRLLFFFQTKLTHLPPLPGYALAVFTIALLIWTNLPKGVKVITLASSVRVTTSSMEVPSSLGFLGKGKKTAGKGPQSSYSIKIKPKGDEIFFSWVPIEHVTSYRFSILESKKNSIIFYRENFIDRRVSIKTDLLEEENLYTWIIEGETHEKDLVEYSGDFIFLR